MKLSKDQIAHIRALIASHDVTLQTLGDDLLDHLCCVIDDRMANGEDFDTALKDALTELAPHGLDKIQRDTFLLLHSPRIILMKKVVYSIGFLSACAGSIGWMFTVFHWPGGYELFNYSFLAFLLGFVPLLSLSRLRHIKRLSGWQRLYILVGVISSMSVGMSLVFKLWHLQGADVLFLGGVVLFAFGFLPLLFISLYRREVTRRIHST